MLPTFFGIGTQRAGTTWIYNCLKQHPQVFMGDHKELHFFYVNYARGIKWYENQFINYNNELACGEICPDYMYHETAIKNIKKHIPDAKLFLILRNPIERAISAYKLHFKDQPDISFIDACDINSELIERGHYYKYLEMVLSHFTCDKVKVLIYEDIEKNPGRFIDEIYEHIGVETGVRPDALSRNYNRVIYPGTQKVLQKLRLHWVIEVIRDTRLGDWVRGQQEHKKEMVTYLDQDKRSQLIQEYSQDIKKLENFISRDLGAWK